VTCASYVFIKVKIIAWRVFKKLKLLNSLYFLQDTHRSIWLLKLGSL